jgi:hypothetical protein
MAVRGLPAVATVGNTRDARMSSRVRGVQGPLSVKSEPVQRSSVVARAAKKAPELPPIVSPTDGTPEWYACVARADFFFDDVQNEALAEQLRELKRYYEEQNREIDFFFVCEPQWLDKFPESKRVQKPAVALVSTDKTWITFMKLRLDRVLKLDLGNMSIDEATKSTAEIPEYGDKPWKAPYTPYSKGWWKVFMRD